MLLAVGKVMALAAGGSRRLKRDESGVSFCLAHHCIGGKEDNCPEGEREQEKSTNASETQAPGMNAGRRFYECRWCCLTLMMSHFGRSVE